MTIPENRNYGNYQHAKAQGNMVVLEKPCNWNSFTGSLSWSVVTLWPFTTLVPSPQQFSNSIRRWVAVSFIHQCPGIVAVSFHRNVSILFGIGMFGLKEIQKGQICGCTGHQRGLFTSACRHVKNGLWCLWLLFLNASLDHIRNSQL